MATPAERELKMATPSRVGEPETGGQARKCGGRDIASCSLQAQPPLSLSRVRIGGPWAASSAWFRQLSAAVNPADSHSSRLVSTKRRRRGRSSLTRLSKPIGQTRNDGERDSLLDASDGKRMVENDAVQQTSAQRLLQQREEAARSGTTPPSNAKKGVRSTAAWILGLAQLVGGRALLVLHISPRNRETQETVLKRSVSGDF